MAAGRRTEEGEGGREQRGRQAGRPAGRQSSNHSVSMRRRRQQEEEEEEGEGGGGLARFLAHSTGRRWPLLPSLPRSSCTPTKISTTTTKSVLSMNDGRIDHNFRRRESIRGSADSGRQEDEEAGGIEEGGQKKAIAREEGRKIEKRRRSKRSGRWRGSRRRKRSQVGWKWRCGIKGARGVRELDSMGKNITWLILQAPPSLSGQALPRDPCFVET